MTEVQPHMDSHDVTERRRQLRTQQSTVHTRRQQAVCVRRAYKRYGTTKNPNVILQGLNMTVPKGAIYGLLGASGCGKTTLLSCIVGRRRLNSGEIWVLGGKPGSKGSGVPGPRIGYMPQEVALYGEFSPRETLVYYGWIAGMKSSQVEDKIEFLMKLLQLPSATRLVKNLSGGQQRRVSFAAALVHDPELLILDEPTVGVDPVLRQSIWDHLVDLTKNGNKTIIITTHYIDETRQAHMIGLMRGGRFLAEQNPESLMQAHNADSLEAVFLKLSKKQNEFKRRRSSFMQEVMGPPTGEVSHGEPVCWRVTPGSPADTVSVPQSVIDTTSEISGEYGDNVSLSVKDLNLDADTSAPPDMPPEEQKPTSCLDYLKFVQLNRMKALIWKNFLWMWRNLPVLAFVILLPMVQAILFNLSIGHDPKGLHFAIYNEELNDSMDGCVTTTGCDMTLLSCRYLDHLKTKHMEMDYFRDESEAMEAVARGRAWGTISFLTNYSSSLVDRITYGKDADNETLYNSDMRVTLDMSNQQIAQLINRNLLLSYVDFTKDILSACEYNVNAAQAPIRFNKPVYGNNEPNFTDFAAPGIIITIVFFLSVALTSGAMLIERNEGMLERMLVAGITAPEILFSHVVTQFVVMTGQTVMVLVFSFAVFPLTLEGSIVWVTLLTLLSGICGMSFGFVVSTLCENERSATYLALGSFLPLILLCGIIWPVEGMHPALRWVSVVLPLTKSTESLRALLARGWTIFHPTVYLGFVSTFIWIIIFLSGSILVLKFKKG